MYLRSSASPSLVFMSFEITTFMAWKASSILLVDSIIRAYCLEGNGPRNSNSLAAAVRRVLRRITTNALAHSTYLDSRVRADRIAEALVLHGYSCMISVTRLRGVWTGGLSSK